MTNRRRSDVTMMLSILVLSALVTSAFGNRVVTSCTTSGSWLYEDKEDSHCLIYVSELKSYSGSRLGCGPDGSIFMIKNQDQDDFLKEKFAEFGYTLPIWAGVDDIANTGTFTYTNGDTLSDYQPWSQPIAVSGFCVSRHQDSSWHTTNCANTQPSVCQEPASVSVVSCDDKWHLNPDSDTCFKPIKKFRKNFIDASRYCVTLGGKLTTKMLSRKNRDFIMKYIKYRAHFWIGVFSSAQDGFFGDLDGTVMDSTSPFKRASTNGHCVSMKKKMWYSKRCERRQFFICQKDPVITI